MLTVLPYETYFGSKIPVDKVKTELFKYLSTTDTSALQYEFVTDSTIKLVFITGRNETEKELPMFEHPILVEKIRGGDCVVVDLRKYCKAIKPGDEFNTIAEVSKDIAHTNFSVLRGLLTVDFVNKNFGILSPGIKNITAAYGMFMTNVIGSTITLTYPEILSVELGCALYFTMISNDSEDIEHYLDITAARCSTNKMTGQLSASAIGVALGKIPLGELFHDHGKSPNLLIAIVRSLLPEDKKELISLEAIYNSISSMWFGPGGAETMVIGIEHAPTWASLVFTATTDNTFKKSRISMNLEKYSKNIKPADYAKFISQYLTSKTIK